MRIGDYEIVSEVGHGGMGIVYRARSKEGRPVAIKLLRSRHESLARFEREQRLLALFGEREGFVPLLDAGSSPGGPYIVMPLIEGGTLADRLRRGALGVDETIALGRALAEAVARAHERGIVHRDLKPANVLFTGDGPGGTSRARPLVADLGLAKHFQKDAPDAAASRS
ncbi:serine/threonine protein kinase, partial [bacterium]|nr:serine/threonine protein kinase [bacterium]